MSGYRQGWKADAVLNEVLSLNAQESLAVRRQAHGRLLLNEVLSLNDMA